MNVPGTYLRALERSATVQRLIRPQPPRTALDQMAEVDRVIAEVAERFGITIQHKTDTQRNRAAVNIATRNVMLGPFDDPEYKLISFFHEIGHLSVDGGSLRQKHRNSVLLWELLAWGAGIDIAAHFGVLFSDQAIERGLKGLMTYVGYQERSPDKLWVSRASDIDGQVVKGVRLTEFIWPISQRKASR